MREEIFFNALERLWPGQYKKIARAKELSGTFEAAFNKHKDGTVDPEIEWEKLKEAKVELILQESEAYPPLLREGPFPPMGLYIKGNLSSLEAKRLVAIVGTRKATGVGLQIAEIAGEELAKVGVTVVSGLALGVDAAAHRGTLKRGTTVAVLAHGLDMIYPSNHQGLAEEIVKRGGALVSEYPLGEKPLQHRFLERNRIVSGLAEATLIIEAPERSGSLATARFAIEQNRDVYVLPGPVTNPNYMGSHKLIREGARLVASVEDLKTDLGIEINEAEAIRELDLSATERMIVEALKCQMEVTTFDKLLEITKLNAETMSQCLTDLTMEGVVKEREGGFSI